MRSVSSTYSAIRRVSRSAVTGISRVRRAVTRRSWALFAGQPRIGRGVSRTWPGGTATDASLIYVPFMAGDAAHAVSQAPARYAQAGAEELLAGQGMLAGVHRIDIRSPDRHDVLARPAAVRQALQAAVRQAVTAGRLPLVLAGSCDAAIGVAAGLPPVRAGVVWFDTHTDFNTPSPRPADSSPACHWQYSPGTATSSSGHHWAAARRYPNSWSCWPRPQPVPGGRSPPPARFGHPRRALGTWQARR